MLFDFSAYIEELRGNSDKKQIVEEYERLCGSISGEIAGQKWYTDYVSKFKTVKYATPDELEDDFDWDLLLQITVASFSSGYSVNPDNGKIELNITVKSGDQQVIKKVSELWSFQILRLYEIYVEEQMNLQILMGKDEDEKRTLSKERELRIKKWEQRCVKLQTEIDINRLLGDL